MLAENESAQNQPTLHHAHPWLGDHRHAEYSLLEYPRTVSPAQKEELPVILTSAEVRRHVRGVIERFRPQATILSQNEIHPQTKIKTIERL